MILEACGKINWSLDITGVREDGYHEMDMLMQPVSLSDRIQLIPAPELSLTTSGHPLLRADEKHLALRAARLLKQRTGYAGGAAISVHKRIPVGAGMGGGSADAAGVLFGLNRLWHTGLSPAELESLGLELGADVLSRYADAAGLTGSVSFDGTTVAQGHFDLHGAGDGTIAWAGIGQHTDLVNPCQFMTFVGSIAAGGQAAAPYVVSSVETPGGTALYSASTRLMDRTMSRSTADTLCGMMRDDVVYNYGAYRFPDVYVCAKSGTAETGEGLPNAMFAGFVQDSRYPLAFICVVENAGSGSDVCVPIVSSVLEACMESMN